MTGSLAFYESGALMVLSATLAFLSLCAAASIPWFAAHLGFWGERYGRKSDLAAARRLGRVAMYGAGAVFFFGMLSFHLAVIRNPADTFGAMILLAPFVAALPFLLAGHGGLLLPYRGLKGGEGERVPVWTTAGAGALSAAATVFAAALVAVMADKSLWPGLARNPAAVFGSTSFAFWMAAFVLVSALVGGVALMLTGRQSFRWGRGESVADGARIIRMGAAVSLLAVFLLAALAGAWMLMNGTGPVRLLFSLARPGLTAAAALIAALAVALIEVLASVLKWRGSAPRASLLAAALVLAAAFCAASIWTFKGPPPGSLVVSRLALPPERNPAP
jgi:hypothetical protein